MEVGVVAFVAVPFVVAAGARACDTVWKMPSIESSWTVRRKQLESCWRGQPAANIVGEACVYTPRDIRSYASSTRATSRPWTHSATRISMCWGRSIDEGPPAAAAPPPRRYERWSVRSPK